MEKSYDQLLEENELLMNQWESMLRATDQPMDIERSTQLRLQLQTNIIALSAVANPMMQQKKSSTESK